MRHKSTANLGEDAVAVAMAWPLRKGEELIDPETGISLGGSSTALGEIEVSQVQEKFSIAKPVSLSGTQRGDKVKGTKAAAPLRVRGQLEKAEVIAGDMGGAQT